MQRLTVSLPDDLVDRIRHAAGGEGKVSAYVARALTEHADREDLAAVLAAWAQETPVDDESRRRAADEFDGAGLGSREQYGRKTG